MKNITSNDNLNLLELLQPLLKWWWLLAISALLAIFSSAFYTMQQPLVYSSTTTIMVGTALSDPNPNGNEFSLGSQLAAAYADIANRSTIQNATKVALGLTWLPEYTARHIPSTQLLEITVVDTIPERAQAVSAKLAEQLVLLSPGGQAQQGRQQFIEEQLAQIEQAITDTDAEIERLELEMAQMFSARQIADTRAQLAALESKRATLQNNYSTMFSNSNRSATNTVVVAEDAALPTAPLNNNLIRNIVLAAILGVAIAGAGAYVLEYSNDTIKSERELHLAYDLLSLGVLPRIHDESNLLVTQTNRSDMTDAYATLRLNLQALLHRKEIKTIAVTGLVGDEQFPLVAANLSVELARSGTKVILVDADLHRPSQQRFFNLPNRFGLSTLLSDATLSPEDLLHTTEIHGLSILPSGSLPANPAALLNQHRLQALLTQLREQADLVVFNIPPVNAVIDALLLANEVDGVILTTVAQQTRRQDLDQVVEAFRRIDVKVIGTVLCSASTHSSSQPYGYNANPPVPPRRLPRDEQIVQRNGNGANHSAPNEAPNGVSSGATDLMPHATASTRPLDSIDYRGQPILRRNPLIKR